MGCYTNTQTAHHNGNVDVQTQSTAHVESNTAPNQRSYYAYLGSVGGLAVDAEFHHNEEKEGTDMVNNNSACHLEYGRNRNLLSMVKNWKLTNH